MRDGANRRSDEHDRQRSEPRVAHRPGWLDEQTAMSLQIAERLVFPTERMVDALRKLARLPGIEEAAILSTCNRTEIYCGSREGKSNALIDWIAEEQQLRPADFQPYLYSHCDSATIRHMFRVASGLDSMVLGEPQILGQMKDAVRAAEEAGALGSQESAFAGDGHTQQTGLIQRGADRHRPRADRRAGTPVRRGLGRPEDALGHAAGAGHRGGALPRGRPLV